jgi:hypothetical protein
MKFDWQLEGFSIAARTMIVGLAENRMIPGYRSVSRVRMATSATEASGS